MALNAYDPLKHHIGLGVDSTHLEGLMLSGAYSKEMQREGLGGQEFGGSTDLIGQTPSLSRWTQDDFTGGGYQEDWSKDGAMFSACSNFISEPQSRALMSCPPLFGAFAFDPHAQSGGLAAPTPDLPLEMLTVGRYIFTMFSNGIHRYDMIADTGLWHQQETFIEGDGVTADVYHYVGMRHDPNDGYLYVLRYGLKTDGSGLSVPPQIKRYKTDFTDPTHNSQWDCPTSVAGDTAQGFTLSESSVVLAASNKLYVGALPTHPNRVDASISWTEIGRLPGNWIASCSYNGRTYILCGDTHKSTSLVAFDGSSIMPIVSFPWNFDGTCISEYAGRLYVGGHGTDVNGNADSAALYEVTGASVRLVRSFAPDAARGTLVTPTTINSLVVSDGLLWMNCKGSRLLAYDVTSDGLFGASEYQQPADFDIYKMVAGYGRLWGWGHSDGSYTTHDGIYRIAQAGDPIASYSAELVTSDFAFEPAVKKRLSELRVLSRYKSVNASISTDGGSTWTALTRTDETIQGYNHICTFAVNSVAPTEHWRFKIDMPMGTNPDDIGELVAYTCDFIFLDTGKHAWTITVNGAEEIEGRDGESVTQDVPLTASTLWGWAEQQTKLTYKDLDGTLYSVQLQGMRESQPVIGPNVGTRPEAFYQLSLIQV